VVEASEDVGVPVLDPEQSVERPQAR